MIRVSFAVTARIRTAGPNIRFVAVRSVDNQAQLMREGGRAAGRPADASAQCTLDEDAAVSPIFMLCRKDDASREIVLVLELIRDLYEREGIVFGA
jgi:hypothetical protein